MAVIEPLTASAHPGANDVARTIVTSRTRADVIYRSIVKGAGTMTLVIMGLIALFLTLESWDAVSEAKLDFLTETAWEPDADPARFGIAGVMYGTFVIALVAMALAVPLSIAIALFVNEFAPRRIRRLLTSLVDVLAAVPSLIYGMWGLLFLQSKLYGLSNWLAEYASFIPFFASDGRNFGNSYFVSAVVVALMVLPITTAVTREVFAQTPRGEIEAALALGGTRWGMIRAVVLPYGRGGIIGGSMLGLGRALGETIAVAVILSLSFDVSLRIMDPGGATVASLIAVKFSEAGSQGIKALLAAGLALFVVTLLVNMAASFVVGRSRSGAGVEL